MSFISKIKNILFEEEIIEEQVNEPEETKISETVPKKPNVELEKKPPLFDLIDDDIIEEEPKKEKPVFYEDSERDLFKSERTFNFPAFDEEEFAASVPRVRNTNVLAKEKPVRKPEKRLEYPKYERNDRFEEKKKFKPSPIISPVYGILDKDYTKEDIMAKKKDDDIPRRKELSIESVRKKAFGDLKDEIENTITKPREEFLEEVKEELENNISTEEVIYEEKRDIEELLRDSAHEEIIIPDEEDDFLIDDIESELEKLNEEDSLEQLDKDIKEFDEEDTLEQDLFELIDSMYDDRKEEIE